MNNQQDNPNHQKSFLDRIITIGLWLILAIFFTLSIVNYQSFPIGALGTEAEFKGEVIGRLMLEGYSKEQAEAMYEYGMGRARVSGGTPNFSDTGNITQEQNTIEDVFNKRIEELHQEIKDLESERDTLQELKEDDLQKFELVLSSISEEQQRRAKNFDIALSFFSMLVGAILGLLLQVYEPFIVARARSFFQKE